MKSRIALMAMTAAALAVPVATAQAAGPRKAGVVVKVDRGGKSLTIVGSKGRIERLALRAAAPRGLRGGTNIAVAGGRVVSAKGKARGAKIRAVVTRARGRLAALTPSGVNIQDLIGRVRLALDGIPAGQTVAVRLSFAANGSPVATVDAPGGDAYGDPYQDPYSDPYPDPETCDQTQQQADTVLVIAVNRTTSRIMVVDEAGERSVVTVPEGSADSLRRGMRVVVTDADGDGTAESVTPASRSREVEGTVAWIDNDFGAFGLEDDHGRTWVINATECQLALLTAGGGAKVTVHRDEAGEVIADVVEATSAPDDEAYDDPYSDDEGDEEGEDHGHGHGHGRGHRGGHGPRDVGFGGQRWAPFFDKAWARAWR